MKAICDTNKGNSLASTLLYRTVQWNVFGERGCELLFFTKQTNSYYDIFCTLKLYPNENHSLLFHNPRSIDAEDEIEKKSCNVKVLIGFIMSRELTNQNLPFAGVNEAFV